MGTTAVHQLRYPEQADPADVPTDMGELAADVERELNEHDTAVTGKVDKDGVTAAATRILASKLVAGHAQPAFTILGDGDLWWGPGGSTAVDTNLYRVAANNLRTDGNLILGGGLSVGNAVAGAVGGVINWKVPISRTSDGAFLGYAPLYST